MTDDHDTTHRLTVKGALAAALCTALVLGALWALDHLVIDVNVLTTFKGQQPLSPLYAFWRPVFRPLGFLFLAVCAALGVVLPRCVRPKRVSRTWFQVILIALALLVPFLLFLVRDSAASLGGNFLIYRGEEYYEDALRIRDLPGFLTHYVDLIPSLSSHGRTHPPGNAAFLYLVGKVLGRSPASAGLGVLLAFAVGALVTFRALLVVIEERSARAAALLMLASPSVLDFACTSMDAVFFAAAGLATWLGLAAFRKQRLGLHAFAAGAALFLAMLFSFSAFPVGLLLLVYGLMRTRRIGQHAIINLVAILLAFVGSALVFALITGFELWECLLAARAEHYTQMTKFIGRTPGQVYPYVTFGNMTAFLIGAGPAVVSLVVLKVAHAVRRWRLDSLLVATLVTLAVMCAGGIYTMEVERIWIFAVPWLCGAALTRMPTLRRSALCVLLAVGWAQALLMEALLFTLW